jgi:hypothetical protein
MNSIFWIGLAVGAILSFAASVVANILHNQITNLLDKRKIASQSKRYATAAQFHALIKDLHSGKRDRYLYLMRLVIQIAVASTTAFTSLAAVGVVIALTEGEPNIDVFNPKHRITLGLTFMSLIFIFIYMGATKRFRDITNAIDDFDTFDGEFKAKWSSHIQPP